MIGLDPNSLGGRAVRRLRANKQAMVCIAIILIYFIIAIIGFFGFLPDATVPVADGQGGPSAESFATWLGTDRNGLSVSYKIVAGIQTAMTLALTVVSTAVPIGVTLGSVAGFYGGKIDPTLAPGPPCFGNRFGP